MTRTWSNAGSNTQYGIIHRHFFTSDLTFTKLDPILPSQFSPTDGHLPMLVSQLVYQRMIDHSITSFCCISIPPPTHQRYTASAMQPS
ncbi:hypothetical protein VFPPC_18188 [Pochonia chlamydosporia 170]|uniref:Uncharacterized protein n=1 Tax=Pochonia chlamydosporia 170 TaxID=1380566 RepID=A0A219AP15_METCM|nr:hypothetical protein VFPPC_18188 [Pochonia chlamydosporia 170]OWT42302.1 hypothetical protein VFPPC_18188 [Pochonia chlamydosporia 170]